VELFSTNGTIYANLNNLQNPGNTSGVTSNATNNFKSMTGNASETILVNLENVTSNGTVIGRVAYYVDDEGTKLNLNNAIGNRSVLNVASRPQDIGVLLNATHANRFSLLIDNSSNHLRITSLRGIIYSVLNSLGMQFL
jgi:hypothetical protein